MKQLTKEELEKTGYQSKFQFGTRVETPCGKKGIVNFCGNERCRVYYDENGETKSIMVIRSQCRILSCEEAVAV